MTIGDERTRQPRTIVWGAGVAASPAGAMARRRAATAPAGSWSARTSRCRAIPRSSSSATPPRCPTPHGKPLPGIAPVAKQQGAYVGARAARPAGRQAAPSPFRYRDFGNLATIGRARRRRRLRLAAGSTARLAWLLWGVVHVSFLIGFRNRLVVMLDWLWAYFTFQPGARLITGPGSH